MFHNVTIFQIENSCQFINPHAAYCSITRHIRGFLRDIRFETLHLFLSTIYNAIWYSILAILWAAKHLMNSISIRIATTKLRCIVSVLKCLINDTHLLNTTASRADSCTFFLVKDQRFGAFTMLAYILRFWSSLYCDWSHINILGLWPFFKLT